MKKIVALLVVLLLVAVVGLAVPFAIGGVAERQMDGVVSLMNENGNMQIKKTSFKRGLFSSTVNYQISIDSPDEKRQWILPMHSVIHHGLFAGTLRKVSITSTPVLSIKYKKVLAPLFGDKPPFTVVATRENAGGWNIVFHSPSFDVHEKGQHLQWHGVEALETIHGDKIVFKANMPGGKFSGNGTDVTIGDIRMSSHGEMHLHGSNLADFTFDATADSLSMNNESGGNDKSFTLTGMRWHQRQNPVASGLLSSDAELSATDLKIGHDIRVVNPKFNMRLDNIDQVAIENISASLKALNHRHLKPDELLKQMFAAWKAQLPRLLARSPKATVAFDAGSLMVQSDKAGDASQFEAKGFHASEQFQVDAHQTLAFGLNFSADSLKKNGNEQMKDAKVGVRLENIYWGFLKELVPQLEMLDNQRLSPAVLQQRERVLISKYLPDILSHSPNLRLTSLDFTDKSGELEADGTAKFDGSGNLNLGDKAAMIKRIIAHLDVVVDKQLARNITLAALIARNKKAAQHSGKPPQPVDAQMVDRMLDAFQQQGVLLSDGEQYGVHADLKDAGIFINGTMVADLNKL